MKKSTIISCLLIAVTLALFNESHAWPFGDADEKIDKLNQEMNILTATMRKLILAVKQNSMDIAALTTGGLVTHHRVNILEQLDELKEEMSKHAESINNS